MTNIRKAMHDLKNEGLSLHSVGKLFYEKHTHLLLFDELNSLPKIDNPTIELEFLLLTKKNFKEHDEFIQQIAAILVENPINIKKKISSGSECMIGFKDNTVAGYVWIHFEEYKHEGFKNIIKLGKNKAYIGPSFVVPQFRGKRIHGGLLSRAFSRAYEVGRSKIYGSVTHKNKASIKGLLKRGYEPIEIHHRFRIGPFKVFPKTKNGALKYYSNKYYFGLNESEYITFNNSIINLYTFIKKNGWEGYDPYDGLNSELILSLSKNSKLLRMLIIQFNKLSPLNFRNIVGIKKGINLKGMGLLTSGFLKLYKLTNDVEFLKNARFCLEFLKNKSLKDSFLEYCWVGGYYNLQFPNSDLMKPEIPSIICTVTCASAFLEDYEVNGTEESLKIAKSSANFVIDTLYVHNDEKSFFKYIPIDKKDRIVYNASTHGVMLLSNIYRYIKNNENLGISKKVMDYIISKQKSNGAWYYSETNGIERKQIDFHQGFILDALYDFIKYTAPNDEKYMKALLKGAEFYKNKQFLTDGRCKWRYPHLWPIDIHNQAQGITTFSKLSDIKPEFLEFAKTIAKWTIDNMQDETGYFYYQKWPFFTNRIPYMRWGQAWMMFSLATLLDVINKVEMKK